MNIIISQEEHINLLNYVKNEIVFGSKLYGLNNENSDTDIMMIYETPESWHQQLQFYVVNHQFQYKDRENNIDYIFTSIEQFWRNLINGDSTINTDIFLFSDMFDYDKTLKLSLVRTYRIMKAYLGFAKRDFKKIAEGNHKLIHGIRCLYMVETLIANELPTIEGLKKYIENNKTKDFEFLTNGESMLRFKISDMLNKKEINHYFIPQTTDTLLNKLLNSLNTIEFKYER